MITLGLSFILLNALDGLLTYIGIKMGCTEMNPLVGLFGWEFMIPFKIIGSLAIPVLSMWIDSRSKKPIGTYLMNVVVVLLIVVCIWNAIQIIIIQGG